ncbi:benzoate/H(+) symporter BenE family transporter [Aeromonas simiae]|uniref:benzoate/H(+) symporter BenE family transporter n=1 Tax=Aeromonas simiae TaxID=218936 RepID=UPI00266C982B|nr:benzoate/H(+) symporter BenE family transporter [Aeromonas simiae]MDO2948821.1 benzoate/H(+) symporter BenE family transporter [Aeromonas simiae]MDO2956204.1 benzoate/H(+) symporter BenE family transporter [Aeromonas simiae]
MPFSLSHLSAGFMAVLVGYTSSVVIILQAAAAAGADAAQTASWLWALGLGMGLTCIGLSLYYRIPVLTAWSTPGAALLATSLTGVSLGEAIGAFMLSSALMVLLALSGSVDKLLRVLPKPLAAAMLAGVLLRFGINLFAPLPDAPLLILGMLALYLLTKRCVPRLVMVVVLIGGTLLAGWLTPFHLDGVTLSLTEPVWMSPRFSWHALIGVGLPLFVVTMASQNLPGMAVLHAHGYHPKASPLIGWTGLTGLLLAPFGGFAYNLAAITAAICMGKEVDEAPARRWPAAVWAGIFYVMSGLFAASVVSLFAALPPALVAAIAGLALLGTIGSSLHGALVEEPSRESALITFLVTASGISWLGIGSAFWGILLGALVWQWQRRSPPPLCR